MPMKRSAGFTHPATVDGINALLLFPLDFWNSGLWASLAFFKNTACPPGEGTLHSAQHAADLGRHFSVSTWHFRARRPKLSFWEGVSLL